MARVRALVLRFPHGNPSPRSAKRHLPAISAALAAVLALLMNANPVSAQTAEATRAHEAAPADPAPRYEKLPEMPGLEQLHRLDAQVCRGGAPVGDEGMESLTKLGIKTILSVENDPEEQQRALKHGLRHVEVPLTYEGLEGDQAQRIVAALNTGDGPYYIHCQHGKHRGGVAAAIYRRVFCGFTADEAEKELLALGCSKKYKTLIESVRKVDAAALRPEHLRLGDRPGLKNVVELAPGVLRGGAPEGEAGFASLKALGVKAVVSLDQTPEARGLAEKAGLGYTEVPMGYDAVTPEVAAKLLKALDSVERPVYIHCHQGHDRVGAAAAVFRIERGGFTNEKAVAEMLALGCSKRYVEMIRSIETYKSLVKG